MTNSPAELMRRNLLEVFDEPDANRRAAVIAANYSDDVVWHEKDRIMHGRREFESRAAELRAEHPDWVFRPAGPASELDDIGHLGFRYGPPDQPPVVSGMDIARTRDGVIIELYTIVTDIRQPSMM
ncbi:nuclear transport factor 2 family protein [Nocardia sp. CA2R105]|uniref:nuclear transport factor 2 family protein n=1 Tax=Nocardia coffeae TaxID=2873381 RepID=UPI001CA60C08|nr:nuclear transport factor 2 family protein [Nocardia coffeae]MBY8860863.1 nuclear transport factor 2 family protein [Nocardia coffeae]